MKGGKQKISQDSCLQNNRAEPESYAGVQTFMWITENNLTSSEPTGYGMLEQILSPANLNAAYKRVKQNKGAGGVDEMEVESLKDYLIKEKDALIAAILNGKYRPNPVRRVEIPKDNGKKRSVAECRKQLSLPVQNKVQHHHHFPKIIWFSIVLFISLAIVSTGWYMSGTTIKEYKHNDTKYRFLKLNPDKSLMQLLFFTDSIYRADPFMRDRVIQKEEDIRTLFDLERKAESMEKEAENLKSKIKNR